MPYNSSDFPLHTILFQIRDLRKNQKQRDIQKERPAIQELRTKFCAILNLKDNEGQTIIDLTKRHPNAGTALSEAIYTNDFFLFKALIDAILEDEEKTKSIFKFTATRADFHHPLLRAIGLDRPEMTKYLYNLKDKNGRLVISMADQSAASSRASYHYGTVYNNSNQSHAILQKHLRETYQEAAKKLRISVTPAAATTPENLYKHVEEVFLKQPISARQNLIKNWPHLTTHNTDSPFKKQVFQAFLQDMLKHSPLPSTAIDIAKIKSEFEQAFNSILSPVFSAKQLKNQIGAENRTRLKNSAEANLLLQSLGSASLNWTTDKEATLTNELKYLNNYLELIKAIFDIKKTGKNNKKATKQSNILLKAACDFYLARLTNDAKQQGLSIKQFSGAISILESSSDRAYLYNPIIANLKVAASVVGIFYIGYHLLRHRRLPFFKEIERRKTTVENVKNQFSQLSSSNTPLNKSSLKKSRCHTVYSRSLR